MATIRKPCGRSASASWPRASPVSLTAAQRTELLNNDAAALQAAWSAALADGAVATHLATWQLPALISAGTRDEAFFDRARHAAQEIPDARFVPLQGLNHLGAHFSSDQIMPHVKRLIDGIAP